MIIKSKNFQIKLEEIQKIEFHRANYNDTEKNVLKIIKNWQLGAKFFTHSTSGSTGTPKELHISRKQIEISTEATTDFIDPKKKLKSSLLCLDPKHIGGAMVIYRALINKYDLSIIEPTVELNPKLWNKEEIDLVSMVPLQFQGLDKETTNYFKVILIGGAPISVLENVYKSDVYSTYGMTETVSHIALRKINEEVFKTTGDNEVTAGSDDQLMIRGSITNEKWLETNDLAEVYDQHSFKWLGRRDFIINSGGIKINPEEVEQSLSSMIEGNFMIASLKDEKFGNRLVLLVSGPDQKINFSTLKKYHEPKQVFFDQTIHFTSSGKIDRIKTMIEFLNRK